MYEMKKMIYMVMSLASLSYSIQTMAQSQGLQKKGECLLPAVAQSATESIGERR